MKSITKITSFLLIFAMLATMLAACDTAAFSKMTDREKAKYIIDKTDEYYKSGVEQSDEMSCEISGEVNGVAIKMEIDGISKRTVIGDGTDKMRFVSVSDAKAVTRTGTEKETENYTKTSAFIDGYMYTGYTTDKKDEPDVYLKSPLTASEFSDFLKAAEIVTEDPDYAQICDNVTVTLSEDKKTYTVKITHGKENVKEELTELTNELTSSFGIKFDLVSFEIEYIADAESKTVSEMKLRFETETPKFGSDQLKLEYESKITLARPENNEPTIDNIGDYVETGDLRYAQFLSNNLHELICAENIAFTMTSSSSVVSGGQVASSMNETDKINCGYKNGIYVYSIDADATIEGQKYDMSIVYNGAQQKIAVNGATSQSTDTNEIVARMYLINILNPVLYSSSDVTKVNVISSENDVTTVEFDIVLDSRFNERFTSLGIDAEISGGSVKITAEFDKDMRLISMVYKMRGDCTVMGQKFTVKGETALKNFKDADLSKITPVKPGSSDL